MQMRTAAVGVMMSASLAAGCGAEQAPEQPLEAEVVCFNVPELPTITEEVCTQFEDTVRAGLNEFSKETDDVLPPPRVTSHVLAATIKVDDILGARCLELRDYYGPESDANEEIFLAITNTFLKKDESVDIETTLPIVIVNAPESMCKAGSEPAPNPPGPLLPAGPQAPPPMTDRCPADGGKPAFYVAARTIRTDDNHPVIVTFPAATPERMKKVIAHEAAHANKERLGHEHILCSKVADEVPLTIAHDQRDLSVDMDINKGSLMSYTTNYDTYISPIQLAYLGVIPKNRIVTPDQSDSFVLGDIRADGPALLQLPFSNPAIKTIIKNSLLPALGSKDDLSINDFRLFLGKLPDRQSVGVYAAPVVGKHKNDDPHSAAYPTYLLWILRDGQTATLEGDMTLSTHKGVGDTMAVDLTLPTK